VRQRHELNRLASKLRAGRRCPPELFGIVTYDRGEPAPTPPACPVCGDIHATVVEIVVVNTREELAALMGDGGSP